MSAHSHYCQDPPLGLGGSAVAGVRIHVFTLKLNDRAEAPSAGVTCSVQPLKATAPQMKITGSPYVVCLKSKSAAARLTSWASAARELEATFTVPPRQAELSLCPPVVSSPGADGSERAESPPPFLRASC